MSISFNQVPSNFLAPFVFVEFSNAGAVQSDAELPYKVLILGQKTSGGAWTADTIQRATSLDQVIAGAGRGSMLHRMAMAYFANNRVTDTYFGVLSDNGAGVAASGTLTVTGPATAAGTLNIYLGGTLVQVAVASGDAQNAIAAAINTAINANLDLPVTSTVGTNVVTVTHRHKGTFGNSFDIRLNYQFGEATPAGVSVAIVAMANGTTAPTLTNLIAALGDNWYQLWAHGYTDATSLTAIEGELSSRFGPLRMIDGVAIASAAGTHGTLVTLGDGRNSPHSVIIAQPGKNPLTPPSEFAAAVAAVVAIAAENDPARPFQTLPVLGVLPPIEGDRFLISERNLQLRDGIATSRVDPGGTVLLDRLVTTYQVSSSGVADPSYRDVTTMLTLMYLRYSFRSRIALKYPRHKLANDGTRFGAGQAVVTPLIAKGEAMAWYRAMEDRGLVENGDTFKDSLIVERNATDVNRLDFMLPTNLINQLIVTAAQVRFQL